MDEYTQSYQYIDCQRAINQNRFFFCYPTGAGKSYCSIYLIEALRHLGEINRVLFLTSSIGVLNLKSELIKLGANQKEEDILSIISMSYIKDRDIFNFIKYPYKTIILSYDSFRVINDYYDKIVNNRTKKIAFTKSSMPLKEWFGDYKGICFFDESHQLGTHDSLRSKAVQMNADSFYYRYFFTATPADRNSKFYTQLKLLDSALINNLSFSNWASQYFSIGNKWSKYAINENDCNPRKWAILQDRLYRDYAVKRDRSELNLPPEVDIPIIYVGMSKLHRKIYEAFSNSVFNDIKEANQKNHAGLLNNLSNTFQYAQLGVDQPLCLLQTKSFSSFPTELQNDIQKFNFEKDFNKLWALDNIINEECNENNNRIIVFYYHPITKDLLQKHLNCKFVLSADILKDDRIPLIEAFKKSKEKILLASVSVANTSFSLNECAAAIYFENTWSYTDYLQSRGRIARIGKNDEVRYYQLCYKNSINQLQIDNLKTKGKTIENLVKKNSLTAEEWELVFAGSERL